MAKEQTSTRAFIHPSINSKVERERGKSEVGAVVGIGSHSNQSTHSLAFGHWGHGGKKDTRAKPVAKGGKRKKRAGASRLQVKVRGKRKEKKTRLLCLTFSHMYMRLLLLPCCVACCALPAFGAAMRVKWGGTVAWVGNGEEAAIRISRLHASTQIPSPHMHPPTNRVVHAHHTILGLLHIPSFIQRHARAWASHGLGPLTHSPSHPPHH